jgi:hypothetical protein
MKHLKTYLRRRETFISQPKTCINLHKKEACTCTLSSFYSVLNFSRTTVLLSKERHFSYGNEDIQAFSLLLSYRDPDV